ncbi:hypothetical protein [Pelagicoccus sp. SDUM812003]|uniref:hypothetical protein n=1 Tax=Pelagicoccus sp. SDUM812003 TaxID=3041267 RepID=UPI00280F025D|nr:hypothetical protein [Pelagicoccus sp. SDUM812003]MDQ8204368.1 hypothetical protein [Pelagicoccus sp. SDUM812003]
MDCSVQYRRVFDHDSTVAATRQFLNFDAMHIRSLDDTRLLRPTLLQHHVHLGNRRKEAAFDQTRRFYEPKKRETE